MIVSLFLFFSCKKNQLGLLQKFYKFYLRSYCIKFGIIWTFKNMIVAYMFLSRVRNRRCVIIIDQTVCVRAARQNF